MCSEVTSGNVIVFTDVISDVKKLKVTKLLSLDDRTIWTDQLEQLAIKYGNISSFAHEFDFSIRLNYNGLRAYMKMVLVYFMQVAKNVEKVKRNSSNRKYMKRLKLLQSQCPLFVAMGDSMVRIRQFWRTKDPRYPYSSDYIFMKDALESAIESSLEQGPGLFEYYNPKSITPWYPEWFRLLLRIFIRVHFHLSTPFPKCIYGLFSNTQINIHYADYARNLRVEWVKRISRKFDSSYVYRTYLWTSKVINIGIKVSHLVLRDRQNEWFINSDSRSIERRIGVLREKKPIECTLLKPRHFTSRNLIVFVHGGGFITLTTKTYMSALRSIVKATKAAVLSIEYSLAPETKYPVALQECLDVYLNLISSEPIIGFKAEKIILAGDSAGGYVVFAMAIATGEIRHLQMNMNHQQLTPLPDAVNAVYPAASGCIGHLYPSRALVDIILPPSFIFAMSNAYYGLLNEEEYFREEKSVWHRNIEAVREVASHVNLRMNDPFFHLTSYRHFDRLQSVPLYIQVGEFDPLLDDSIALAKCWKGKVTLDVVPEMSHGFMAFDVVADKKFQGVHLITQKLKEALGQQLICEKNNEGTC